MPQGGQIGRIGRGIGRETTKRWNWELGLWILERRTLGALRRSLALLSLLASLGFEMGLEVRRERLGGACGRGGWLAAGRGAGEGAGQGTSQGGQSRSQSRSFQKTPIGVKVCLVLKPKAEAPRASARRASARAACEKLAGQAQLAHPSFLREKLQPREAAFSANAVF